MRYLNFRPSSFSAVLVFLYICLQITSCYAYQPRPTKTIQSSSTTLRASQDQPTSPPLSKRGVEEVIEDNLDLYQAWASMCKSGVKNNVLFETKTVVASSAHLNNLWKTVTQTVNCGKGQAVTVTKTVAPASATFTCNAAKPAKLKACKGQCWSDYLWHTYGDSVSPAQGFTGIVCIIIGLYLSILGSRFFRPTLGIVGFVFFATMTWIGLVNNEPAGGYPLGDVIYICVSCGLGILGAIMLMFIYPLGLYILSCLGGFYLAVFLLSWRQELLITIKVARVCFIIGLSLLGPVTLYFAETIVAFLCTSLVGAYLFYFGIDIFAHTGFINPWLIIFDGNPRHCNTYIMTKAIYIELSFVVFNTLASFGWQYYWLIICLKMPGVGVNPLVEEKAPPPPPPPPKKEEPPCSPAYVCMPPPPYCPPQPMFMQNVGMPCYPVQAHHPC